MKDSTFYTLLGCAGLSMAVGSGSVLYSLDKKVNEQKIEAIQELRGIESRRKNLEEELRTLPKTIPEDECRGLIYNYSDLEEQYAAAKKTVQRWEEGKYSSFYFGLLFGVISAGTLLGLASARRERKNRENKSKQQGGQ